MSGWIGVDFDGTLVEQHGWGVGAIGAPIMPMVERVREWLEQGEEVRIFTARVAYDRDGDQARAVQSWCEFYFGQKLPVTCRKDFQMKVLYDDRCVQVITNTGELVG